MRYNNGNIFKLIPVIKQVNQVISKLKLLQINSLPTTIVNNSMTFFISFYFIEYLHNNYVHVYRF